jgi:hypothetical protein
MILRVPSFKVRPRYLTRIHYHQIKTARVQTKHLRINARKKLLKKNLKRQQIHRKIKLVRLSKW